MKDKYYLHDRGSSWIFYFNDAEGLQILLDALERMESVEATFIVKLLSDSNTATSYPLARTYKARKMYHGEDELWQYVAWDTSWKQTYDELRRKMTPYSKWLNDKLREEEHA